jgi:hypothetical protein
VFLKHSFFYVIFKVSLQPDTLTTDSLNICIILMVCVCYILKELIIAFIIILFI